MKTKKQTSNVKKLQKQLNKAQKIAKFYKNISMEACELLEMSGFFDEMNCCATFTMRNFYYNEFEKKNMEKKNEK